MEKTKTKPVGQAVEELFVAVNGVQPQEAILALAHVLSFMAYACPDVGLRGAVETVREQYKGWK